MRRGEIEIVLNKLCEVTADAVNAYVRYSDESTDQMPELLMSAGASWGLFQKKISTILEVGAETLRRRMQAIDEGDLARIHAALEKLRPRKKIDLVVLSDGETADSRRPMGFVEFKKWKYANGDVVRITNLLKDLPGAKFAACIILRNTGAEDKWTESQRQNFGTEGFVATRNVNGFTKVGQQCSIACIAQITVD